MSPTRPPTGRAERSAALRSPRRPLKLRTRARAGGLEVDLALFHPLFHEPTSLGM